MDAGHDLAMRLRAAYTSMRRRTNDAFAPLGMTSDQFVLLTALADEGPATQEELVRRCHSDTNTIRAMLTLLEEKGLIARQRHASDGRARCVHLTAQGKQVQQCLWEVSDPIRARMLAAFAPGELEILLAYLDRIAQELAPPKSGRARKRPTTATNEKATQILDSRDRKEGRNETNTA